MAGVIGAEVTFFNCLSLVEPFTGSPLVAFEKDLFKTGCLTAAALPVILPAGLDSLHGVTIFSQPHKRVSIA